jgi:hypothetical protein
MATIYDPETGNTLTDGLQGSKVCDEAINAARRKAADRGKDVVLEDDDGTWLVKPDGSAEEFSW